MKFGQTYSLILAAAATSVFGSPVTESQAQEPSIIKVKLGAYGFEPHEIQAEVGDSIQFHFGKGISSVVQSDFDTPCQPLDGGFVSETFTVDITSSNGESSHVFEVPITNTNPIAFYNGGRGKCNLYGYFGVINGVEGTDQSYQALRAKARTSGTTQVSRNPGEAKGGETKPNPDFVEEDKENQKEEEDEEEE
ncbi:hypothetical protein CFIMG_007684RA00001 [Ceratocystis fimbriata CBS 114723]|uniref:Extracellular serine-rich protein n=1 Tax=Ceratocystis fimbriata CBS 114723 TaxID=1035309 RepID=A0A2C5XBA4_9PEZI|nr:hypothetical protein CFIMG_007684RA00001 [Ceratocystis fimbriata CBS 114723]